MSGCVVLVKWKLIKTQAMNERSEKKTRNENVKGKSFLNCDLEKLLREMAFCYVVVCSV
jgi:hypothetical protein